MKVVLTFEIEGTEEEAWGIAEALEDAARNRGYLAANSWVEGAAKDRGSVFGMEGGPEVKTSAMTMERRPAGSQPMSIGSSLAEMATLGDDDGRSIQ